MMMRTAISLSLAFAAVAWAGPKQGILTTNGEVWMNSVSLPSGSSVQSGDSIATDRLGHAILHTSRAGRIEIRGNSYVTLEEDALTLHRGVVRSHKMPVRVGGVTVEPAALDADPSFVVAQRGNRTLVAANKGDLRVLQPGAAPLLVPAGSYAMPASPPEEDRERSSKESSKRGGGAATASTGWSIGSLSHGQSVLLLTALGAAGVAGSVAALTLNSESPSPSQ